MTVKPTDLERVSANANGIYEAILAIAKRARQIHNETKIELNQRLETLAQLTTIPESEEEIDVAANPDQLRISLEFETRPKPTELALKEWEGGKVTWRYREPEAPPPAEEETA